MKSRRCFIASGTFREANPELGDYAIRINPNRSGEETVAYFARKSVSDDV
jgi:hypothetical protein